MAEVTITEAEDREYRRYKELGTPSDLADKVKKNGELETDNFTLREERRKLKEKVPVEGATVLLGDDAKRWDAFQALGKTPEEIAAGVVLTPEQRKEWEAFEALQVKAADVTTGLKERDNLKAKDAQRARTDTIAAVVEAMGWPKEAAATLADMKSLDEATFEMKTEKVKDPNGAETESKVPYVTAKGAQPVKFAEFASANDSLKGIRTTTTDTTTAGNDNRWMEQPVTGAQGGYDPAKAGREMAQKQLANAGSTSAALT